MGSMFSGCKALTSLDVSKFDTSNVTDMRSMFSGCKALTSLDVSKFDTSNVTDMKWMFNNCKALITITASEKFVTDKVTNSSYMFADCTSLKGGAGTVYDENHTGKEYARIDGGTEEPGYFTKKQ
jgi:surface protein